MPKAAHHHAVLTSGSAYGGTDHVTAGSVNVSDSRFSGNVALGPKAVLLVLLQSPVEQPVVRDWPSWVERSPSIAARSRIGIVQGGDSKAALEADGGNGGFRPIVAASMRPAVP